MPTGALLLLAPHEVLAQLVSRPRLAPGGRDIGMSQAIGSGVAVTLRNRRRAPILGIAGTCCGPLFIPFFAHAGVIAEKPDLRKSSRAETDFFGGSSFCGLHPPRSCGNRRLVPGDTRFARRMLL